jgi:hypothetical protein
MHESPRCGHVAASEPCITRLEGFTLMGAIAALLFAIAFFIHGSGTSTNVWFDPTSLMYAGLFCLALHLLGVGTGWYSSRRR